MIMQDIPVIDIRKLDEAHTLAALDSACREWGFFQVVNHGIDMAILDKLNERARAFFAMPREDKLSIARTEGNPWGYFDEELTKNTPDVMRGQQLVPSVAGSGGVHGSWGTSWLGGSLVDIHGVRWNFNRSVLVCILEMVILPIHGRLRVIMPVDLSCVATGGGPVVCVVTKDGGLGGVG